MVSIDVDPQTVILFDQHPIKLFTVLLVTGLSVVNQIFPGMNIHQDDLSYNQVYS